MRNCVSPLSVILRDWLSKCVHMGAGNFAACGRQSNQNAAGDAADGHFVPIGPLSPDPITGNAYL